MKKFVMTTLNELEAVTLLIFTLCFMAISNIHMAFGLFDILPLETAKSLSFDALKEAYYGMYQILVNSLSN